MAITLYDATVAGFVQILDALEHSCTRGQKHCQEHGHDPGKIIEARLRDDMLPFRYQVEAAIGHSVGAIEGCKAGVFNPPKGTRDADFNGLLAQLAEAKKKLAAMTPEEVNALEGKEVLFAFGEKGMPFLSENFLLSFSIPNFHFHATTAYDIMRAIGVPLGKKHYLGRLKIKTA
jgi:uncharacterized protein